MSESIRAKHSPALTLHSLAKHALRAPCCQSHSLVWAFCAHARVCKCMYFRVCVRVFVCVHVYARLSCIVLFQCHDMLHSGLFQA